MLPNAPRMRWDRFEVWDIYGNNNGLLIWILGISGDDANVPSHLESLLEFLVEDDEYDEIFKIATWCGSATKTHPVLRVTSSV